jgi:hypothetical protein
MPTLGLSGIGKSCLSWIAPLHAKRAFRQLAARQGKEARMGPINWLAVVLAAAVAGVLCPPWYRAWGLRGPQPARLAALIVPALLMGTISRAPGR